MGVSRLWPLSVTLCSRAPMMEPDCSGPHPISPWLAPSGKLFHFL